MRCIYAAEQDKSMAHLELLYVGDPMCSWCYGFAPEIQRLDEHFPFPTRLIIGGLRPGPAAEILDDRMRRFLQQHWKEIGERTGQPFDLSGLDRNDWTYDTLLPDTAAVVMRDLNPNAALSFFVRLQRALYAEAVDITDPDEYQRLLVGFDVDADDFVTWLTSDEMLEATYTDFGKARGLGATGFPSLYLQADEDIYQVSRGYAPAEMLEPALSKFIEERFPDEVVV